MTATTLIGDIAATPAHDCTACKWYRPAKPLGDILVAMARTRSANKAVYESLNKIGEQDASRRKFEAQKKMQQADVFNQHWGHRPAATAYCGLQEDQNLYLIFQLKNRGGRCRDYDQGPSPTHSCADCLFRIIGAARSDNWDGEICGTLVASELEAASRGNGILTKEPEYLDYCYRFSKAGEYHVCSIANRYDGCAAWERGLPCLSASAIPAHEDLYYEGLFLLGGPDGPGEQTHKRISEWLRRPGNEREFADLLDHITKLIIHLCDIRPVDVYEARRRAAERAQLANEIGFLKSSTPVIAGAQDYLYVLETWLRGGRALLKENTLGGLAQTLLNLQQLLTGRGICVIFGTASVRRGSDGAHE